MTAACRSARTPALSGGRAYGKLGAHDLQDLVNPMKAAYSLPMGSRASLMVLYNKRATASTARSPTGLGPKFNW